MRVVHMLPRALVEALPAGWFVGEYSSNVRAKIDFASRVASVRARPLQRLT
jgi:hypothetical protein